MGKFAYRPLVEELVNLPVGLWRRNWLIWKWGNLPVGLWWRNWLIWKWGNLPIGLWWRNWLICLSVFGGEIS
jgi:hypothetical protein